MNLEEYLKRNGVWYNFIRKPETVHTADAAKTAGLDLRRVTKNLVARGDDGKLVLLVIPGDKRVDLRKAAEAAGIGNISLVPFEEAEKISGYPPGGTPSVGHKTEMRVVLDRTLLQHDTVFCGGGSRDRLLELKPQDVVRLTNATTADITK